MSVAAIAESPALASATGLATPSDVELLGDELVHLRAAVSGFIGQLDTGDDRWEELQPLLDRLVTAAAATAFAVGTIDVPEPRVVQLRLLARLWSTSPSRSSGAAYAAMDRERAMAWAVIAKVRQLLVNDPGRRAA